MIPLEEARAFVLSKCSPGDVVSVPIDDACDLITAADLAAVGPIPPFDNTAIDGFAVRSDDVANAPVTLEMVGTLAAGAVPATEVGPGQAIRIMTGAPMPPGADAVVMVELTSMSDDETTVDVAESVPVGNHIRPQGDDVTAGQVVFPSGTVLGPAHLGVCTSIGVYDVAVHARPRIGVISTGDEQKVLTEIGDMAWMQVAIKPAKPLAFGTVGGTPVFGLPGNPVSSMVSFELFARPGIRKMMGYAEPVPRPIVATAGADMLRRPDGKTHFARVFAEAGADGRYRASFSGGQGSHQLSAMAAANALAIVPDGDGVATGEPVELLLL